MTKSRLSAREAKEKTGKINRKKPPENDLRRFLFGKKYGIIKRLKTPDFSRRGRASKRVLEFDRIGQAEGTDGIEQRKRKA